MPAVKAIVLGAAGQLGSVLTRLLGEDSGVLHKEVSITDQHALDKLLTKRRPDVVFNCAAYNAVDRAETERDLAFAVNSQGPANLATVCARYRIRLVHFSTNFVFDGTLDRPYIETDSPAPLSVYGSSKLDGEQRVLHLLPGALVIRTSAVYGDTGSAIKGGSFPERIVERARHGDPLLVVADQKVNPTFAGDLAPAAMELAASRLQGIVHVVAAGCVAWDEFARATLAECGVGGEVEATSSADLASAAVRPLNGCLGSTRVTALRPWRDGLHDWATRRAAKA
ncbi:MAG: dTDP-4-dehydrorhamnose reductase [Candidatus Dormibacteraceae bacterium]